MQLSENHEEVSSDEYSTPVVHGRRISARKPLAARKEDEYLIKSVFYILYVTRLYDIIFNVHRWAGVAQW